MEQTPHLDISEFGDSGHIQKEDDDHGISSDIPNYTDDDHIAHASSKSWETLPCQHYKQCLTSQQDLERHTPIHDLVKNVPHGYESKKSKISSGSDLDQQQHENVKPSGSVSLVTQLESSNTSGLLAECNMPPPAAEQKNSLQEENLQQVFIATSTHGAEIDEENKGECTGQYMLDVSSSISENLSFYFDGKIVSTSTVSGCETADAHSVCSNLVGLDAHILDPSQFNLRLNIDSIMGNQELQGLAPSKRRTATPPLLPQIQTELESEAVVSSSSSLVMSLMENLLPQNTESTVAHPKKTAVFLSPKLKQLLEMQDNLNPALVHLPDGQTPCSPVSPVAAGKYKRRTVSPQSSPQHKLPSDEETAMPDTDGSDADTSWQTQLSFVNEQANTSQIVEEPQVIPILTESWPPVTVDNCSQQPLDLSNTMKRNEHEASTDAALDLSLQKRTLNESELTSNLHVRSEGDSNLWIEGDCVSEEQNLNFGNPETPLVTDFTIVTGPSMVDSVAEGLVYGLGLPPCSLNSAPATLTPLGFPSASPCTIAFGPPTTHAVLPTASSLITVLAPPLPIPSPSSQPIQVLAPNISPEPLVLGTENSVNSAQCDLTSALAATNTEDLPALSQTLDHSLNLPGHMFLTDQIAFKPPINEGNPVSEVAFTPTATLNDPLINSYNITSNTVLIECTISLETPVNVPSAVTMQENTETPGSTHMLVNHIEQQHIVSLPNTATVDPTIIMSSIEESVSVSATTSVIPDCPSEPDSNPDTEQVLEAEPPNAKEEECADVTDSAVETLANASIHDEKMEEVDLPCNTPSDAEQQTFTKNFICNVCDQLFHSMKELGHHVGDHADEWPYKCEFCVLLFDKPSALLDHRSSLHGVDKTYVCSACTKDFVYLCNLKQHQEELHPAQQCSFTEEEKGKIRPQNYNYTKAVTEPPVSHGAEEPNKRVKKEENEVDLAAEELFTTIKIMASEGGKLKGPDVRLGINQHYPSFKPPPFPYHNRSPAGSLASATNFTTHNIPQTFSTAIRCTKCGKSFDNMPELHKHILACANASDKRRYTPKKNPIPLHHFAKSQNGVLSITNSANEFNASNGASQSNRSPTEPSAKVKLKFLNKKRKLVQRVMPQRNKSSSSSLVHDDVFICPHCSREFTMRRSRTKHMAVCPKKPKEVRARKDGGMSVTKENDGRFHRVVSHVEQQQDASSHRMTRLQTSGPPKRPVIPPAPTSFSNKRMKFAVTDTPVPKNEMSTLNELPIVRSFNPPLRQYTRVHHGVKGIPVKITLVKQQTNLQRDDSPSTVSREEATIDGSSDQSATA
ncbi:PR domain zinc finger protein 2 [Dunckerocampus dactyliophorus]|uniref:PR domain zinc finger protein 2 n=1 Tax=Dunckerocampus dactyliophorus TaxID=161453 RepID=UPI002406E1EE|nr:PR domain zinc finger protein 2 [Dunckerocampus dactyliophorus]XP_054648227.1 PR domain zinc finger protein 2 [Dunckerocampus dactyliophorus]XP_054648237.1 PR domain zinc finger protein 2 [Dunckerocampus dactyliophorus]XP_054648246.1 PR domain zinc finger protein 2 [Dunckerocampus dactyliophorus]XP_054648254.1 PR domain zinc finger protein 2 [Dunckerocampus dactyliophorus]